LVLLPRLLCVCVYVRARERAREGIMVMTVLMAASSATAAVLPQALVSSSSKGRSSSQGYGELCRLASRRRVCVRESFRSWKPLTTCALPSSVSSRYYCAHVRLSVSLLVYLYTCVCVCVCVWGSSSLHTYNTQSLLHCISYQEGNRYDLGIILFSRLCCAWNRKSSTDFSTVEP
jgi:hypothetical protein